MDQSDYDEQIVREHEEYDQNEEGPPSFFERLIWLVVIMVTIWAFWSSAKFFFGEKLGIGAPQNIISFGYARPVSCSRIKYMEWYRCVLKNHDSSYRAVRFACGSFDSEGRVIGSARRIREAFPVTMMAGEERIVEIPYESGSRTLICSDTDSVFRYDHAMELFDKFHASGLSTDLKL